jgi:hypothetical protein
VEGASYFDPGEPAREVALVLLEATALPRRLAASREWPSTLRPHEWQVLLAIGLGSASVDPEGSQTPRGIAAALALDLEDVYDALGSLRRERLAAIEFRDPEVPEAEEEWLLTRNGADAAARIVGFAGRVIGWPPAPPTTLR